MFWCVVCKVFEYVVYCGVECLVLQGCCEFVWGYGVIIFV